MPLGDEIKTIPNEIIGIDNRQADYGDFMTSFMPWHDKGMGPETKDGETALMYNGKYYILNGDWMLAYAELAPQGFDACLNFFMSKPQFVSSWSNYPDGYAHPRRLQ